MAKNAFLTKPIEVLRDTFVNQGDFGFVDLEKLAKWLDEQRKAEVPDVLYWKKLFHDTRFGLCQKIIDRISAYGCGELVSRVGRIADHDSKADYEEFLAELPDPAKFFISSLDRKKVVPYWVSETSVIYLSYDHKQAWVVDQDPEDDLPCFKKVEVCDLLNAALCGWSAFSAKHSSEPSLLCSWMAEALERLRGQAEAMFDIAVAVSQNGRHILNADYVIAYEVGPRHKITARSLEPSAILPRKLVLGSVRRIKQDSPRGNKKSQEIVLSVLKSRVLSKIVTEAQAHGCGQVLLTIGSLCILFTPEATIPKAESVQPSPDLPDIEQGQPDAVQFDMNEVAMYGPLPSDKDDEAAIAEAIAEETAQARDGESDKS